MRRELKGLRERTFVRDSVVEMVVEKKDGRKGEIQVDFRVEKKGSNLEVKCGLRERGCSGVQSRTSCDDLLGVPTALEEEKRELE